MQVAEPYCSETPLDKLVAPGGVLTASADFFVRNHAPGETQSMNHSRMPLHSIAILENSYARILSYELPRDGSSDNACAPNSVAIVLVTRLLTSYPFFLFAVPYNLGDAHVVRVELNGDAVPLSVHELRTKFKQHTVTATMQCSGNRASEMISKHGTFMSICRCHPLI
jgi:hypothetical protein